MSLLALLCTLAYPTVESEQFSAEQQRQALAATVRIVLPQHGGEGTGVIVARRETMAFILTANHVVDTDQAVSIQTFTDVSYPKPSASVAAEVWERWPNEDLALLRTIVATPPSCLRICPEPLAPKGDKFPVLAVGCTNGSEPTCLIDTLKGSRVVAKPDGTRASFWMAGQIPAIGRSGGPLIDRRGYVVGICSGRARGNGFYTQLTEIHKALANRGLAWVYTDEPKNAK